MSGSRRVWDGSRARSKRSSSSAASGSADAIWSITSTRPPSRVTRASSETATSGRVMWCSVRWQAARSNESRSKGIRVASPSTKLTFSIAEAAAACRPSSRSSGTRSSATTSPTSGASARASAPVPAPESITRSSPPSGTNSRTASRSASRRPCSFAATRSAVLANRLRTASAWASSDKLQRLLSRRDRARCALLGDQLEQPSDLGSGREAELVTAEERLGRIGRAGLLERTLEVESPVEGECVVAPRLGLATEAVHISGGRAGGRRAAEQGDGVAPELTRDGQQADRVLEED